MRNLFFHRMIDQQMSRARVVPKGISRYIFHPLELVLVKEHRRGSLADFFDLEQIGKGDGHNMVRKKNWKVGGREKEGSVSGGYKSFVIW